MYTTNHYIWLAICVVLIVAAVILLVKLRPSFKTTFTIFMVICIASEVIKTFGYSQVLTFQDVDGSTSYTPYLAPEFIPFHLCYIQTFLVIIVRFMKDGKLRNGILAFMYPTCIVGAFLALTMPIVFNTVDASHAFTNVMPYQYFLYHSALVVLGIYIPASGFVKIRKGHFASTILSLIVGVYVAIYLNSALAQVIYVDGETVITYIPNFLFVYGPPIPGLELTTLWQWILWIVIESAIGIAVITACYLPFIIHDRNKMRREQVLACDGGTGPFYDFSDGPGASEYTTFTPVMIYGEKETGGGEKSAEDAAAVFGNISDGNAASETHSAPSEAIGFGAAAECAVTSRGDTSDKMTLDELIAQYEALRLSIDELMGRRSAGEPAAQKEAGPPEDVGRVEDYVSEEVSEAEDEGYPWENFCHADSAESETEPESEDEYDDEGEAEFEEEYVPEEDGGPWDKPESEEAYVSWDEPEIMEETEQAGESGYEEENEPVEETEHADGAAAEPPDDETDESETSAEEQYIRNLIGAGPDDVLLYISKRAGDGRWQVKYVGSRKIISQFNSSKDAQDFAKILAIARDGTVIIRRDDGIYQKIKYKPVTK